VSRAAVERVAPVGTFHWNVCSDEVIWSAELHRIFDYRASSR
jgi:hypothetical protein